jgi:hypothetical protein
VERGAASVPEFRPPRAGDQGDEAPPPGPPTLFPVFRVTSGGAAERTSTTTLTETGAADESWTRTRFGESLSPPCGRACSMPGARRRQPRDESGHVGNQSTNIRLITVVHAPRPGLLRSPRMRFPCSARNVTLTLDWSNHIRWCGRGPGATRAPIPIPC